MDPSRRPGALLLGRITAGLDPDVLPRAHARALRLLQLGGSCGAFEVSPGQLGTALDGLGALGFRGISLAPAHQEAALSLCARVTPTARALGRADHVSFGPEGAVADDALPGAIRARLALAVPSPRTGLVLGLGLETGAALLALARLGVRAATLVIADPARARPLLARLAPVCPETPLSVLDQVPAEADVAVRVPVEGPTPFPPLGAYTLDLECPVSTAPRWLTAFRAMGGAGEDGVATFVRAGLDMFQSWHGDALPENLEARVRAAIRAGSGPLSPQSVA